MGWAMEVVSDAMNKDRGRYKIRAEQEALVAEAIGVCTQGLSLGVNSVALTWTEWQKTVSGGKPPKKCFQLPTLFNKEPVCL